MARDERICANCGYDLMGSRPKGRCPECGNAYNAESGAGIRGSAAAEEKVSFVLRRIRTILLGVAALLCVSCGAGISYGFMQGNNLKPFVVSVMVAVLLLIGAVTSYLYERDETG